MDGPKLDGHRLARLARQAIAETVGGPALLREDVAVAEAAFDPPRGNFVTLTLDGQLRGCIGSLMPHGSLVEDVLQHACSAAFNDPRFEPLHRDLLPRLTVEVSLLSPLQPLTYTSEADLLRQLRPEVDGLLLEYQGRSATFLPQVWENLHDPCAFLLALKQKAGWPALFWSTNIKAWTYTAEAWRDEPRPVPPQASDLLSPSVADFHHPGRHWHRLANGRIRCEVCPHECALGEGQRGRCFQRQRLDHRMVLTGYGQTSGFSVGPIEKKPLHHFLPGSSVLSFGTVGCNLSCRFCQNWNLSRSRDLNRLHERATPEAVASAARELGCRSVAFTYNEPAIFLEYVSDVAEACHAQGIATVAVTAGYLNDAAREDFFTHLDAANVDLKAFSEGFYKRVVGGSLQPVLDTLRYLVHKTDVWTEITTLLIPGLNDSDDELHQLCDWMADDLGVDIPLHFSAFHPDHRMRDVPPTPLATLRRARTIALGVGLKHVYIGNVRDSEGATTYCPGCDHAILQREGFQVLSHDLDAQGRCRHCGAILPGRFGDLMLRRPQSLHTASIHA
jgi:pyruvate formate lyase activating enzyme